MKQYLGFLKHILDNGLNKPDRTGTGTKSVFGYQMRFNLQDGFPLLTTKKVHFKSIVEELLWFIKGDTNIRSLVMSNVRIWNDWPFASYVQSEQYKGEDMAEFIEKIKLDEDFATLWGDLGPVYGKQWRDFNGCDQLQELIDNLKTNPYSRRHIISSWNPAEISQMALPPCHAFIQFYVNNKNELSCQLYQRSADAFLGVPFNIASYSLLTMMIAHVCGLKAGDFVHTFGDAHIYDNHVRQVHEQLQRTPRTLPTLTLNQKITSLFDFTVADITLNDYDPWPLIKAKVAV